MVRILWLSERYPKISIKHLSVPVPVLLANAYVSKGFGFYSTTLRPQWSLPKKIGLNRAIKPERCIPRISPWYPSLIKNTNTEVFMFLTWSEYQWGIFVLFLQGEIIQRSNDTKDISNSHIAIAKSFVSCLTLPRDPLRTFRFEKGTWLVRI
jgi:hypothetical protein